MKDEAQVFQTDGFDEIVVDVLAGKEIGEEGALAGCELRLLCVSALLLRFGDQRLHGGVVVAAELSYFADCRLGRFFAFRFRLPTSFFLGRLFIFLVLFFVLE